MLSTNLFRPLTPPSNAFLLYLLPEDEDLCANPSPSWPHLQIAYDILLRLIISTDAKTLRDLVNQSFILSLLGLFNSEDPRERESLKNAFHQIYLKFTFHRSFMREAMNDVFLHFIFEIDQKHCGIGE
ncbi:Serine/threonine protein like [Actinidia chinensis var. chinensis]|uniref:Serine/threonine protein like n=1 Tax=Actinidia chinensis var. chinensis TaxID=1590841 RepID=A0A2R6R6X8_ACTCC|nr:Serine/threonine protein like [Actinidia chinensis var. chinensis]